MFARISQGRVAGLTEDMPELAPGECAALMECGPEVREGWVWTPEGFAPPELPAPDPNAAINAQIAALESMQTPRLIREAALKKTCTVCKPGCCIDGMTPEEALAALDAEIAAIRATAPAPEGIYYQVK